MPLDHYKKKRDFSKTPEPAGTEQSNANNLFMMHKHAARRLHYDLRLEFDGVLLSWAVTRGPSLNPKEKRLAVHVEDHPIEYADFEGIIPENNYGAGETLIYDRGYWQPIGDVTFGLKKGHLQFELYGQKLKGKWHLVRIAEKGGSDAKNWLLIKAIDEYASDKEDITRTKPLSVKSGLSIEALKTYKKVAETPLFFKPMLAKPATKPPESDEWLHEVKFDGYRMQVRLDGGNVRFFSRQGNEWSENFLALSKYFAMLPCINAIIDGEIAAVDQDGRTNFSLLQTALTQKDSALAYYAFDLIYYNGVDLRERPLVERKRHLSLLFKQSKPPLFVSEAFYESGSVVLNHIRQFGLEGIVSKRKDSVYRGIRSDQWRKVRCISRQEFVVGGFTINEPGAVASLLVGTYDGKHLIYNGRVGTGFGRQIARQLFQTLNGSKTKNSPFSKALSAKERQNAIFVRPATVVEIEYLALTKDGRLRHASFKGIRLDKSTKDVKMEETIRQLCKPSITVDTNIKFTNLDRIYWPDCGLTKQNLIDYYEKIWPHISKYICRRPLSLLRCPEGITGQQFFQKHAWAGMDSNIRLLKTDSQNLIYIDSVEGLLALAQGAVLEIHPWGATIDDIHKCNRIVMDIDPDVSVTFSLVRDAAREIRDRLKDLGLESSVKTSGGKGLHVVSDLPAPLSWEDTKTLTQYIANAMTNDNPELYLAQSGKQKRVGKMFIDYQRNYFGATAVAAYSPRARPLAPISLPISWEELDQVEAGNAFHLADPQLEA